MFNRVNKILIAFVFTGLLLPISFVFADNQSNQTSTIEKALETVKEQVSDLVGVKDENKPGELATRIETFKKVIDFSITEAKDLKIKLLDFNFKGDDELLNWQKKMADKLNEALIYYDDQNQTLDGNEKNITLDDIKIKAQKFKEWRETNYLPISEEINDFLLVKQEKAAIQITKKRYQKISEDVQKLKSSGWLVKVRGLSELPKLLTEADTAIKESDRINNEAEKLFREKYIVQKKGEYLLPYPQEKNEASTTLKNLSNDNASDTARDKNEVRPEQTPPLSIKDTVKTSLTKVKDAYRIFIEMSNLVRKLLS